MSAQAFFRGRALGIWSFSGEGLPLDPLEIIESTAEPAFATDESGRVVIWNPAAERLLGYPPEEVLGSSCHEVICGRDIFGNRFCDSHCNIAAMVERKESINRFPLTIRKADGRDLSFWLTIIAVPGGKPSQFTVIHILGPQVSEAAMEGHFVADLADADLTKAASPDDSPDEPELKIEDEPLPALTAREHEVLKLMAQGTGTSDIADALFISVATVRSHTQSILGKLGAHSKLEAVAIALRRRLL